MIERMLPATAAGLDEAELLAHLTAELKGLERDGKVSREAIERELLWLAIILASPGARVGAGDASSRALVRLCSLVRGDASRLRRQAQVLRQTAKLERSKAQRRRRAVLRVLDGGVAG